MGNKQLKRVRRCRVEKSDRHYLFKEKIVLIKQSAVVGEVSLISCTFILLKIHFFTNTLNGKDVATLGRRGAFICCPCHWMGI